MIRCGEKNCCYWRWLMIFADTACCYSAPMMVCSGLNLNSCNCNADRDLQSLISRSVIRNWNLEMRLEGRPPHTLLLANRHTFLALILLMLKCKFRNSVILKLKKGIQIFTIFFDFLVLKKILCKRLIRCHEVIFKPNSGLINSTNLNHFCTLLTIRN